MDWGEKTSLLFGHKDEGFEFRAADSLSPSLWKSHLEVIKATLPPRPPPSHWRKWRWEMESREGAWSPGTSHPEDHPHPFSDWLHFYFLIFIYSGTILGTKMLIFVVGGGVILLTEYFLKPWSLNYFIL